MKYIIYARKSQEDKNRQIQSIPDQLRWAYEVVEREGLDVIETFTDTQTAKTPGRPGFTRMMEFIHEYKGELGLIAWKIDRFARNPLDEGAIKFALMSKKVVRIRTMDRDYSTDDSQILLSVDFGAATQYSIDLSKNVKRGMKSKREQGWLPNKVAVGYVNEKSGQKGSNRVFTDHEGNRFHLIKKAWGLLLSGSYSPAAIRTKLNDEWGFRRPDGNPMSLSGMYYVFHNVFYAGHFYYDGELIEGKHDPMITLEQYDRAQLILGKKGKPRKQTHNHKYTGLVRCSECGCMITAEPPKRKINKKGEVRIYNYMRCSKKSKSVKCSQPCIRLEDIESQFEASLDRITIPKAFHEWAVKQLRVWAKEESKQSVYRRSHIQKKYNENEAKMDRLVDALLNKVIDDSTYKESRTRYQLEQKRLKNQLGECEENKAHWLDKAEKVFNLAREAREKFDNGDRETKRRILNSLGSNFLLEDKKLLVELQLPFKHVEKALNDSKAHFGSLEPLKKPLSQLKTKDLEAAISKWLPVVNGLRTSWMGDLREMDFELKRLFGEHKLLTS